MDVWHEGSPGTIDRIFDDAVREVPDRLFLEFSGETYTYQETSDLVARSAHALRALGVDAGMRVVTLLDNSIDSVVLWLATLRLGAVYVPVNTANRGEFLRHQVSDAGAVVAICELDYADRIVAVLDGLPELRHVVLRDPATVSDEKVTATETAMAGAPVTTSRLSRTRAHAPDTFIEPTSKPSDLAMLIYTAGTTGPSKGCMASHNYVVNTARQFISVLGRRPGEHAWTCLPMFHLNAFNCTVLPSIMLRSSASVTPRFSLSGFWPSIERTGAKVAVLLGTMISLIASMADTPEMKRCFGQLRVVQGAPFPPALVEVWQERFGVEQAGADAYGLTEASLVVSLPAGEPRKAGSCGRRNNDFDTRIFDDGDREVPDGTVGEIVVRPRHPHVMFEGYWGRPEAVQAMTRNMWFHTGDLGMFDEDGFFHFVDRKKDSLRRRGENISSYEMETTFLQHADVVEVAVHSVPSEVTEDDVKVSAVLRVGSLLTEEDLCKWSLDRVPYFAVPRYIEFRSELPKNPVGRIIKYRLREEGVTAATWDRERSGIWIDKR